jgi:hypothetical protein
MITLSVIGSAITIDIIAAQDPLQVTALGDARLHNVAGVLLRVICQPYGKRPVIAALFCAFR